MALSKWRGNPHGQVTTGKEIEKSQVVKGYEYDRGQFLTFSPEELRALDVESSKAIDLERFVSRGEIDPVYFDTPYYLYPDGPVAVQALRGSVGQWPKPMSPGSAV